MFLVRSFLNHCILPHRTVGEDIVGLEEKLRENYNYLEDPTVLKDAEIFFRENPYPKAEFSTLFLKRITKSVQNGLDLPDSYHSTIGIQYSKRILKIAYNYCTEGIRRLESGEDEGFENMLGHWHGHAGYLLLHLARIKKNKEEPLEKAEEHYKQAIKLFKHDPYQAASYYAQRAKTNLKRARISKNRLELLLKASNDTEHCILNQPMSKTHYAIKKIKQKGDIAMMIAQCKPDDRRWMIQWLKSAYEEYRNCAVGFEEFDDIKVPYIHSRMAEISNSLSYFFKGEKKLDLIKNSQKLHSKAADGYSSWDPERSREERFQAKRRIRATASLIAKAKVEQEALTLRFDDYRKKIRTPPKSEIKARKKSERNKTRQINKEMVIAANNNQEF